MNENNVVLAWVTWRPKADENDKEVEEKKTMFAIADGTPKPEIRQQLTEMFQQKDRIIEKLTPRRYSKKPHWMKDEKWEELIDGN